MPEYTITAGNPSALCRDGQEIARLTNYEDAKLARRLFQTWDSNTSLPRYTVRHDGHWLVRDNKNDDLAATCRDGVIAGFLCTRLNAAIRNVEDAVNQAQAEYDAKQASAQVISTAPPDPPAYRYRAELHGEKGPVKFPWSDVYEDAKAKATMLREAFPDAKVGIVRQTLGAVEPLPGEDA